MKKYKKLFLLTPIVAIAPVFAAASCSKNVETKKTQPLTKLEPAIIRKHENNPNTDERKDDKSKSSLIFKQISEAKNINKKIKSKKLLGLKLLHPQLLIRQFEFLIEKNMIVSSIIRVTDWFERLSIMFPKDNVIKKKKELVLKIKKEIIDTESSWKNSEDSEKLTEQFGDIYETDLKLLFYKYDYELLKRYVEENHPGFKDSLEDIDKKLTSNPKYSDYEKAIDQILKLVSSDIDLVKFPFPKTSYIEKQTEASFFNGIFKDFYKRLKSEFEKQADLIKQIDEVYNSINGDWSLGNIKIALTKLIKLHSQVRKNTQQ
ncbi:Hypothetical protein, predicted lipoprotein [Mycoplasmopsis bovigenitalium 51080]|uniref:Lipoprotein n=1 Tax=Mycoplasmopsis bovigenitalium 51080 TaxID=1188235 RepID=N9VC60_9BACT|nr:hypothetical protein [Mycoplasmopsis bovigenitalium]ENY69253.1 Hypothetical protein, predicted lipoprotein [Mycoplasmopsis bovigenitalium 51080]